VPVFCTKRRTYLEENLGALDIELTPEDLQRVDDIAPREVAAGPRYMEVMMRLIAD
jgi:aryl-alcohol dehydrogenase-like predicted oxidoreductase